MAFLGRENGGDIVLADLVFLERERSRIQRDLAFVDGEHVLHDIQNIIGQIAEVQLACLLIELLFVHL